MDMRASALIVAAAVMVAPSLHAGEFAEPLRELARTELKGWLRDAGLVAAVRSQNAANSGLTPADLARLDEAWQNEVGAPATPTIGRVLGRPESAWLRERKEAAAGLITEVFVMDRHGLNVAQSDVTSDYWQGDEAKWQETYGAGPGAIHISEVEYDGSTQTYQSQVSLTLVDPATGEAIGAATFGIDVSLLH